jgi:hypothetical protein
MAKRVAGERVSRAATTKKNCEEKDSFLFLFVFGLQSSTAAVQLEG